MRLDDNSFDYKPLFSDIEKQKGLSHVKPNESILKPEEKAKDLTRASNIAEQLLEQLTSSRVAESISGDIYASDILPTGRNFGKRKDEYMGKYHLFINHKLMTILNG